MGRRGHHQPEASPSAAAATEFITSGQRLGEILIKYRQVTDDWHSVNTATLSPGTDDADHGAAYQIPDGTNVTLCPSVAIHHRGTRHRLDADAPK